MLLRNAIVTVLFAVFTCSQLLSSSTLPLPPPPPHIAQILQQYQKPSKPTFSNHFTAEKLLIASLLHPKNTVRNYDSSQLTISEVDTSIFETYKFDGTLVSQDWHLGMWAANWTKYPYSLKDFERSYQPGPRSNCGFSALRKRLEAGEAIKIGIYGGYVVLRTLYMLKIIIEIVLIRLPLNYNSEGFFNPPTRFFLELALKFRVVSLKYLLGTTIVSFL
jgi:hypothetical protein